MVSNRRGWLKAAIFVAALVLVNIAARYGYTRIDFTKEGRFTLSPKTKSILKEAKQPISITVFLDGELPAAFKRLRNATKDLLTDYRAYAGTDIKVIFVDPIAGLSAVEQDTAIHNLYQAGIEATTLNIKNDNGFAQKTIFPMAIIAADGKRLPRKVIAEPGCHG